MPPGRFVWCLVCEKRRVDSCFSFHGFPKDEGKRQKWLDWCCNNGFMQPNDDIKNVYICGAHFERVCFKKKLLRRQAVPTLVQGIPANVVGTKSSGSSQSCKGIPDDNVDSFVFVDVDVQLISDDVEMTTQEHPSSTSKQSFQGPSRKRKLRYIGDFRSEDMEDVPTAKKFRRLAVQEIGSKTKENLALKRRNKRLTSKITNLEKQLLTLFKRKNLVTGAAVEHRLVRESV